MEACIQTDQQIKRHFLKLGKTGPGHLKLVNLSKTGCRKFLQMRYIFLVFIEKKVKTENDNNVLFVLLQLICKAGSSAGTDIH